MQKQNERIEGLQILRAIAFFEIFLGHCGIQFFTGAFGVSIFMVLSGFCMAINYLPKVETMKITPLDNVKFAWSKVKRIYGMHLIMLAIAYIFVKMPTSVSALKKLIANIFLMQSLTPHSDYYFAYNGVAWYLSTYLFICLFAPCVMKLVAKCKNRNNVLGIFAIIYGIMFGLGYLATKRPLSIGDNFACWFTYIFPGYRLLDFSLGAALGWLYLNRKKVIENTFVMTFFEVMAAVGFIVVILIFHKVEVNYPGLCYTVLFTPVSLALVMVFACSQGLIMKCFNNPFLRWVGNISSYTFLIHQIPIRWLRIYGFKAMDETMRTVLIVCISFGISALGAVLFSKKRVLFKNRV